MAGVQQGRGTDSASSEKIKDTKVVVSVFRRNSLDIFTADYSVKMGQGNKVDSLQQKTAFHMKVRNSLKELSFCTNSDFLIPISLQ